MPLSRRRFVHLLGAGTAASLVAPGAAAAAARGFEARFDPASGRVPNGPADPSVIRLDSNENPNGPGRAALDALAGAMTAANRYPFPAADALRAAVARAHGAEPANVCLGAGSTDVLRACVQAFTGPGRALVTAAPTFESPAAEAALAGAPVRAVPVRADLRLDLDAMAEAARGAGLVYVCNPNNPTATVHGQGAVRALVERVLRESPGCAVVLDEAYHEYVDDPGYATAVPLALATPRVVVARTFSKVHGLAGARVGYAVAHADTAAAFAPRALDIGLNAFGAAAALASLADPAHVERERALNRLARAYTRQFFADAGYAPAPSDANFLMVDLRRDAAPFRAACRAEGVRIGRPFPPLLTYARVSVGTLDEMRRATAVFRRALAAA